MRDITLHRVDLVANSTAAINHDLSEAFGMLMQYRYVPGSSPLPTGANIDIVGRVTGFVYADLDAIGTSAFQRHPRYPATSSTGGGLFYNSTDSEPVACDAYVGGENLRVTLNSTAVAGQTGTLWLWVG